ncbi:hypothetical protein N865_20920 [Intrasporangium oryzae NRRL B-24470]|uniref:Zinc finger DksA/TraR C4-type domain-containing protein n=1 Tax=Intrasporangium oryzae NRRL B-24470 TaxID=1386089 RepID=W9G1C3_9MICO|nr:hypothetical protein N865_20920 [Intrasporangium oryzae NRRL B-24470]
MHAARLAAERHTTDERLVGLRRAFEEASDASEDSNADDEHDPEGATIAYERSQIAALIDQAQAHLAAIDAAEERLEAGTYGLCSVCGEPIPEGRLEARPTATTCVLHASASAS